ncbi:M15 family metallopeptidase [Dermacoccaceae bacterium W4C1]
MNSNVSRRSILGGLLATGAVAPLAAQAAGSAPRAPWAVARAVAPGRAVIAVDAGGRSESTVVTVTDGAGVTVGRSVLNTQGTAVVPLTLTGRDRMKVAVEIGSTLLPARVAPVRRILDVDVSAAALAGSLWRVVNKRTPMTRTEAPERLGEVQGVQVDRRVVAPLQQLLRAGAASGVVISNGFRSYDRQSALYSSYVARDGRAEADTFSARPGFSEHQTGLAFDAKASDGECSLQECFGQTPAGEFLAEHGPTFGFVVRYTSGNHDSAGYEPEPWHLRYVGPWLARYLQAARATSLETAFALPPAPDYDA